MTRSPLSSFLVRAFVALFAVTAAVAAAPTEAHAHRTVTLYEYDGGHPIPEPVEGWCDEHGVHVHSYALDPEWYPIYEVDGVIVFVGDPTLFGYRGQVNWYYDPHPIGHVSHHWCVLEGPHSHLWAPVWTHRNYGRRYWSTYDTYYVYTGLYDGWFSWSWDLYYTRVWGVHVRYVNRYRNVYSHRHPIYTYVDHRDRRPSWSGRHRHPSNHDSARPRSSWGGDRDRNEVSRRDGDRSDSSQARPRGDRSGPANGEATWEGGSSAGSRSGVSEDRRGYGDRDRSDSQEARSRGAYEAAGGGAERSRSTADSSRVTPDRSTTYNSGTYGGSSSSSRSRTYGGSSKYDTSGSSSTPSRSSSSSKYDSSRNDSRSKYDTSRSSSSSSRTYGTSSSSTPSRSSSSSRTYGTSSSTPSRSSSSSKYGTSSTPSRSSSTSSSSKYDRGSSRYGTSSSTPSRSSSSSSRTYGGSSSSSSRTYGGSSSSKYGGSSTRSTSTPSRSSSSTTTRSSTPTRSSSSSSGSSSSSSSKSSGSSSSSKSSSSRSKSSSSKSSSRRR